MVCRHTWHFINVLIIIKTAKINVNNFHGSLTTVVRAQNDTFNKDFQNSKYH